MPGHSMRVDVGRTVDVRLPAGYDPSRPEPYPLLVLHDGQNLFASRPDARGGSWHADETIERLIDEARIPPLVLAAIDHGQAKRIHEFTPTQVAELGGGGAPEYADVVLDAIANLAEEVHVRTDRDGMALGGSSLGG